MFKDMNSGKQLSICKVLNWLIKLPAKAVYKEPNWEGAKNATDRENGHWYGPECS